LADVYDNYLASERDDVQIEHHVKAVEYRRAYEDMVPGSFGPDVPCALCDASLGGLSVDDEPVSMTCAWDSCPRLHHFHTKCFNAFDYTSAPGVMCPACAPK
jgi:hypothetical protein